jgi:poly-gamma-glutamate capsule biosynthesis protein CapA/YwtB (metallophosphatase superfamily)
MKTGTHYKVRFFCLLCLFLLSCNVGKDSARIMFAGDLMLARGVRKEIEKHSLGFLFSDVKKILNNSDLTIANFESTACDASLKSIPKQFTFRTGPEFLSAIFNAGIHCVTIANNHSSDFGYEGFKQTVANLQSHHIIPVGLCNDTTLDCLPGLFEVKGNNIALFASSLLSQKNNYTCTESVFKLTEQIIAFKRKYPAYLVFVNLHWGIEMKLNPTKEQIEQAHSLIIAGADAVIGHHPHVVQSIEIFKGKYIFYSIGNFIFDNNYPPANQGIIPSFSLSKGKIVSVQIIPFTITHAKPIPMGNKEAEEFINLKR